jgi:hypothetical protein
VATMRITSRSDQQTSSPDGQVSGRPEQQRGSSGSMGVGVVHPDDLPKGYHVQDRAQAWHSRRP